MTTSKKELNPQDIWGMFAETDRRFKETDKRFEETDKQLTKRFEETKKVLKELAEQSKRTDEKIENLIGTWGKFVEGLVEPAAIKMFQERGIEVEEVSLNRKVKKNGQVLMEIDILLANGEYSVLIEVKTTLKVEDVNDHIERLSRFKEYFPRYADTKVIGAVAGIKITEDADKYAYKKGLFVITQSGDTVKILNDKYFKPKEW